MNCSTLYRSLVISGLLVLSLAGTSYAQQSTEDLVDELMETAIAQMNEGEYEQANLTFRKILRLDAVLPDELSYLFAETLYMVDQYHNSRSFLDKYIRLVGTNGRYYSQAMDLKHYLDKEYELILMCKECDNRGYRLIDCDDCHGHGKLTSPCQSCRGVGINMCDPCKGQGVTTSVSAFQEVQYQTCSPCKGKGRTACKACLGAKEVYDNCTVCNGTARKPSNQICDHEPSESDVLETVVSN